MAVRSVSSSKPAVLCLKREIGSHRPGLIAASVWMTFLSGRPRGPGVCSSRPSPEMMPCVSVWSRPKGFPMAYTCTGWRCIRDRTASGARHARDKVSVVIASLVIACWTLLMLGCLNLDGPICGHGF